MPGDASYAYRLLRLCNTRATSERLARWFLAPLALCLMLPTSTGCTVVGYAVGAGMTPDPQSVSLQGIQSIPRGTDVEVFYMPEPCGAPVGVEVLRPEPSCELKVESGAYEGIAGEQLRLRSEHLAQGGLVETYGSGGAPSPTLEVVDRGVPLARVRLIRTKPSSSPKVVGALVGAFVDVFTIVAVGSLGRHVGE